MPKNNKAFLGLDGVFTLTLSFGLILCSCGVSFILAGVRVYKVARTTKPNCDSTKLIIVHGMKLAHNHVNDDFKLRLDRAIQLQRQHNAQILLLGGITGNSKISEAEAGKLYLTDRGVKPDAILVETTSRHTLENLKEARLLIRKLGIKHYALLSNRYHLARIAALSTGLRMNCILIAAEDKFNFNLPNITRLLLEAAYIHWYYTGKFWSYATNNTHSIDRIS